MGEQERVADKQQQEQQQRAVGECRRGREKEGEREGVDFAPHFHNVSE